jgi:hypothetical protein
VFVLFVRGLVDWLGVWFELVIDRVDRHRQYDIVQAEAGCERGDAGARLEPPGAGLHRAGQRLHPGQLADPLLSGADLPVPAPGGQGANRPGRFREGRGQAPGAQREGGRLGPAVFGLSRKAESGRHQEQQGHLHEGSRPGKEQTPADPLPQGQTGFQLVPDPGYSLPLDNNQTRELDPAELQVQLRQCRDPVPYGAWRNIPLADAIVGGDRPWGERQQGPSQ